MNNPFDALPSYIKESPKFSKFLRSVNDYLMAGVSAMTLYKDSFISTNKPRFVISALAKQFGVTVDMPFVGGLPDYDSYYEQLELAYRAKSFNLSFTGKEADFLALSPLSDVANVVVIDFAVAKKQKTSMSVVYSVLSMNKNLTATIVRDYFMPKITGVSEGLFYVQFGQVVFGFDVDDVVKSGSGTGVRIVYDAKNQIISSVPIDSNKYVVTSATIQDVGSGYKVGDEVSTDSGISFKIVELKNGAFLQVVNPSKRYETNPTTEKGAISVSGGSGAGMTVNITGGSGTGYFIKGWDNGAFIPISRRS